MFTNCRWKAELPLVCEAVNRGVIGSINFRLITSASTMLRQEQTLNPGGGGIDAYNDLLAAKAEDEETDRAHEEQGLETQEDPRILGGKLKAIAAYLNEELLEHAEMVKFPLSGKVGPNPWQVGETVAQTLQRQIVRTPRDMTAAMKMEAKALGVSEEVIKEALARQQATNATWLVNNRDLVLEVIDSMHFENPDGLSVESIFDSLPVMIRFSLYAAADGALYRAAQREAQRYIVNNRLESKSNVGLLNGERRVLRSEINAFLSDGKNKREIRAALEGGATVPLLQPLPPVTVESESKTAAA